MRQNQRNKKGVDEETASGTLGCWVSHPQIDLDGGQAVVHWAS